MSLTLLGWVLVASSVAISAVLVVSLLMKSPRREQLDVETCTIRLADVEARLKVGKLNEAEARAARIALLGQLKSSSRWGFGQDLWKGRNATLTLVALACLLVTGIGAATSYLGQPASTNEDGSAFTLSRSVSDASDADTLARLKHYTRSLGTEPSAPVSPAGNLLPDVDTMIERLAARLETAPDDVEGWRMLGWSYFHRARYEQSATAYGRAIELDPSSAELKVSYDEAKAKAADEAKAKAAGSGNETIAPSQDIAAVPKSGDGPAAETMTAAMPPTEREAVIRSMVDGLATRLETSPRDVDGWTRLMRSRIVLGEKDVAASALRKALEVFKDDLTASAKITAAANELGLNAQ